MRPLRRPDQAECDRWENLARTKNAKAAIAQKKPAELNSDDFDAAWRDTRWKNALAAAQDGLCAWCTRKPEKGGDYGDVEHVRPKAEVHRHIAEPGAESGYLRNVIGRRFLPEPALRPGYYWRAYDPTNMAFSCKRCNSRWKVNLWPVTPWLGPCWAPAPTPMQPEQELLLDPFAKDFDPLAHFQFNKLGVIMARPHDDRAEVTIRTLGLDRESLCDDRRKLHRDMSTDLRAVRRAIQAGQIGLDEEPMVRRLTEQCSWSSPHAAFYRVALHHTLKTFGFTWGDLAAEWGRLQAPVPPKPPDDAWIE